ncbi:hypothetical protein RA276_29900, partial [Pseudomonas syringae pv. tagetis]|uniref:hypothetical protein n=1 Tax=Pseudomonas syringae group genomosp. 7 TaxID=251699 RepID=UPI00376F7919
TISVYVPDQIAQAGDHLSHAQRNVETPPANFYAWYNERVTYLTGDTWPEESIVQQANEQTLLV